MKDELVAKLSGLTDDEKNEVGIRELFDTHKLYQGPYLENAPDLLVGLQRRLSLLLGYGDRCGCRQYLRGQRQAVERRPLHRPTPGSRVVFCNRKIDAEDPALIDIAPTALDQFGIKPPKYMDGKVLFTESPDES